MTVRQYLRPSEADLQELFRTQVVARMEGALVGQGEKCQQNGKTEAMSRSQACRRLRQD